MVDVTQQFLDEINNPGGFAKLRGNLSNYGVDTPLDDSDFVSGSISRVTKAVVDSNFQIGDVHRDYLTFTLIIRDNTFPNLIGSDVTLEYGAYVGDDKYEWCPLGKFTILPDGVVRYNKTISVTAYSMISKTEKNITELTSGTPYDLALWACNKCGVELATTKDEFNLFANSNVVVTLPNQNDHAGIKTYRDLLMWVANLTCTFVTCGVDGKIKFKTYSGIPVCEIHPDSIKNKQFNDYSMNIQNVTMTIGENTYNLDENALDENTLELDSNPLLVNYVADGLRLNVLNAIKDELSKIRFTPFKFDFRGNPALEVGDWVTYRDNSYLITSSVYKYRDVCTIQGVGIRIGSTKKQSTTIRGSSNVSGGSSVQYSTIRYTNIDNIEISNIPKSVFEFAFELGENISPMLTIFCTCDITEAGLINLILKYDNVDLIPMYSKYMPIGKNSISFTYPLAPRDVSMTHRLYGYISSNDGAIGTISPENVISSISAWGITSGVVSWDGNIAINEDVPVFELDLRPINMLEISESGEGVVDDTTPAYVVENVGMMSLNLGGISLLGLSEDLDFSQTEIHTSGVLKYTATQATLSGSAVLRQNDYAEDGYDIDYLSYYEDGGVATWKFELPFDSVIQLDVEAATKDNRYLAVYIDGVVVNSFMTYNSGSYETSIMQTAVSNYQLSAGTHSVTVARARGSYSPLVDFIQITYTNRG